jgi:hypothetical protein
MKYITENILIEMSAWGWEISEVTACFFPVDK